MKYMDSEYFTAKKKRLGFGQTEEKKDKELPE